MHVRISFAGDVSFKRVGDSITYSWSGQIEDPSTFLSELREFITDFVTDDRRGLNADNGLDFDPWYVSKSDETDEIAPPVGCDGNCSCK